MTIPAVSVALASYNGEQFIGRQLDSIAAQSMLPSEIVVSDGGSSDRTTEVVSEWFAAHPEVNGRLIADGTRLGVTKNFERAIAATRGDLIALCDQDDIWSPDRVRLAVEAFAADEVLLVNSDARLVGASGEPLGLGLFEAIGVGPAELRELAGSGAFELLIRRNLVTGATVMVRRELAVRAMPFPDSWVHDEWMAILAAAVGRIHPMTEQLIDYRQHGENEIGVTAPTLRYRIGRMLQPRGSRYLDIAARSAALDERLTDWRVPPGRQQLARGKRDFENRRAAYPPNRFARLIPIVRNARGGSYRRLSSQGRLDMVRDFVQPR